MLSNKFLKLLTLIYCLTANIFAGGFDVVNKYNISVPVGLTVHSVSGIFYKDNFIFAYYAGQFSYQHGGSAKSSQDIYVTRGIPGNWQMPQVLANADEVGMFDCACFDPVLFQVNNKVYLFYRIGHSPRDWKGFVKISCDGIVWSEPIRLPENILGPAKCKPLLSDDGKNLICGSSFQKENASISPKFKEKVGQDGWASFDILVNFADDNNFARPDAWIKGAPVGFELRGAGSVVIQPATWQDNSVPGKLHALCRANTGKLVYTFSNDFGKTWAVAVDSELPSNYSAIDIAKMSDGRIFMAWNPLETTASSYDQRWMFVISELIGSDPKLGNFWNYFILERDENKKAEYSFPSLIPCDGKLFAAYGINRKELVLVELAVVD